MKRRAFITLLGGAAAWPLAARAQQIERMRSVGVLMTFGADEAIGQTRVAALLQGLQQAGWEVGAATCASSCAGVARIQGTSASTPPN
jgi:putative ABC transport system substrate-binding protein